MWRMHAHDRIHVHACVLLFSLPPSHLLFYNTYILYANKCVTYMYSCKSLYKNFVPIVQLAKPHSLM